MMDGWLDGCLENLADKDTNRRFELQPQLEPRTVLTFKARCVIVILSLKQVADSQCLTEYR